MSARLSRIVVAGALACVLGCSRVPPSPPGLGPSESLAAGVQLYRTGDAALVDHAGPIAVWLVRVDPELARFRGVLSNDEVLGAETVEAMRQRHPDLTELAIAGQGHAPWLRDEASISEIRRFLERTDAPKAA